MRKLIIRIAILQFAVLTMLFPLCSCTNGKWESFGSYGEKDWPLSITKDSEKYEFDYVSNTAIHYFDAQNAEKIWFKRFKNPQNDALRKQHVTKVQKYMDDGWIYSDETKGKQNWPCFIYKGTEKYVFNYNNNTVEHYFDPDNAELICFSSIQDPKNDVLNLQNMTNKVEKYIVDGWRYHGSYGNNNWPLSISKGNEKYEFDYQNNTALHSWDNFQNAEILQFNVIQDPQKDALGKRNVTEVTKLMVNGWSLDGSFGNKHWPQTMSKGNNTIKFDYQNKSATLYNNGKEVSKTWFSQFNDPANDYIKQNNVVYIKKAAENGWTYSGSYGRYEYPTSMSKGNEKYEFDYKNGFIAYHFVNGRRTEALEFNIMQSPMDVINKRSEAKIKEYVFDFQGKLYRVKYLSKFGNYYLPFDVGSEGREEIGSTSIYKKGTGIIDDVVIDISQQFNPLTVLFEGRVYEVFEIEKGTGVKKKIAEVPQGQLKAYLLNILYSLEGSYDDTPLKQQNNDASYNSTNQYYTNSYVVIDGSELRLRLGPSTSADTFKWGDGSNRHPNVGEKFKYLGESGDFYKIDYKGHELWVSKKYTHLE